MVRLKRMSQVNDFRKSLPQIYKTISHLSIDLHANNGEEDLDDFTTLHSLSLSNGTFGAALPPSLRRLCLTKIGVFGDLLTPTLPDSLPLKRMYLVDTQGSEDVLSIVLQRCSSTLEHLVLHNTNISLPTSSLYPRLDTLSYTGSEDMDLGKEGRATIYSLLRGSVLGHLCYSAFYLFPMEILTLHATRLVYLELDWTRSGIETDDDDEKNEDRVNADVEGGCRGGTGITEERYVVLLFETLVHLKVLQHLVLYGPSSFTSEMLVKVLPSSPLAFPHLRCLTISSDSSNEYGVHTAHRDGAPVARLDFHSITLYYSPLHSRAFHMPRLCPPSSSRSTWWQHLTGSGTHAACPFESTHHRGSAGLVPTKWTRPKKVSWLPTTLGLVHWCNQRNAVLMLRDQHDLCPLVLLQGAMFSTTCPYDDCVCRLSTIPTKNK